MMVLGSKIYLVSLIFIDILQSLCHHYSTLAETTNESCNDYISVGRFIQILTNRILPQKHLHLLHDIDISNKELSIGCDTEILILTFLNINTRLSAGSFQTVTITGRRSSSDKVSRNSTKSFHRFLDWSWINFVLWDGFTKGHIFEEMTNTLKSRAVKDFFIDFTVIWQRKNYNPQLLNASALKKLKFKIELVIDQTENWIHFYSECFYCNNGQSMRTLTGSIELVRNENGNGNHSISGLISKEIIFPDYTKSFNGKVLRVTGGIGIPLLMDFHHINGEWIPYSGFMIDPIFFHLKEKMNFSISTKIYKTFGSQLENGSFTGFINELYQERSEIGMAGQSYDRIQAVHFLNPIHIDSVSFVTAMPDLGIKWQAVFRTFNMDSWILFLSVSLLIVLPLYIIIFWQINTLQGASSGRVVSFQQNYYQNGIAFIYRPIMEQDLTQTIIPQNDSGKILMISWLCTVLIISVGYKSKLTSLMVYPETEQVPNTFEVLSNSKYQIILHYVGGALYKNIQSTPSSTFKKLGQRLKLETSMYKCLLKTQVSKKTVCISYIHNLIGEIYRNFTDSRGISNLRIAMTNVFMTAGSYMLPKSAIYKDSMSSIVSTQISNGFGKYALDKAFQRPLDEGKFWARERPDLYEWSKNVINGPQPLRIRHLQAPFVLLFFGLFGAFGIFGIIEKYSTQRIIDWIWIWLRSRLKTQDSTSSTRLSMK